MTLLKRHRLAKGMTLEKAASRIGVAYQTVGAWESGRHLPRPRYIGKLAQIYGIAPMDLTRILVPDDHPGDYAAHHKSAQPNPGE